MKTKQEIIQAVETDRWMMDVLRAAQRLELPDWWICAGFVRSKIWDVLHGFTERTPTADVDVIYFEPEMCDEQREKELEAALHLIFRDVPWSVKNQARMHRINGVQPFTSAADGMAKFPETATALGVKLDSRGNVALSAPCGTDDVLNMHIRPTPFFKENADLLPIYKRRLTQKNWTATWPDVQVMD